MKGAGMADLIKILESFNRKERFFLIREASGEKAFSLSEDYRKKLASAICIDEIPCNAFVAMDYHFDWLYASLFLADKSCEEGPFCNDIEVSTGTQQDIDLLVAFKSEEIYHLILVEANRAYGSWNNKQLAQKSNRLRKIFGKDPEKRWSNVKPFFCMTSPRKPQTTERPEWPEWMTNKGSIRWFELGVPSCRRKLTGCDKDGKPNNKRPYFKIEKV